ncbi:filamentous haemagglutinin family protein [Pararobbsia silviterrae]|uniref:filamentous haemagglutinin family protein n=1 Tax=Pararobbsia silviterrae TaxID=1792498 RepID=UPI001F0CD3A5|nr:filamentous haemagglutinin family protein [Pararobbsia silviterrae]
MVNLANVGAQISTARGAASSSGLANLGVSPTQALASSQPSIQNLAHAAQSIAQQIAAQQAAAAAGTASTVPNGLAVGGLQVAPGITFNSDGTPTAASSNSSNSVVWINADAPTQTNNANGTVTVNVTQTGQDAILTWQTMNVGKQTTLNFNQSAGTQSNGTNNWIVLNRIMDPNGLPSQILGDVTAQGTVLVINRNGILFGAGSQINVHSLVASSLDLLNSNDDLVQTSTDIATSNQLFLNGGLAELEAGTSSTSASALGNPTEILGLGNVVSVSSASQYTAPGNITIEPGALINTVADGSASNGGFVLIAAPNVTNEGSITVAATGQVVLAAGVGVSLIPESTNPQFLFPELTGKVEVGTGVSAIDITPAGTLTNTGIVQAERGDINLLGSNVNQDGVVSVLTSINTPGNITISTTDEYLANTPADVAYPGQSLEIESTTGGGLQAGRAGALIFGPQSLTAVLPDEDGETATSSGTTFTAGSVDLTAGSVWFQSGSLVEAPGSTVSVTALTPTSANVVAPPGDTLVAGRIYVDSGAIIDVSGLANVELPMSAILLDVGTINENELADSPLLRDSFLNGLTGVVVDSTLTGVTEDGLEWVGSPILNLEGAVALMPRSIDQLLTNGGTITLSGAQVMTATGSSLDLNGGYIHYLGGMVDTTRLVDADGAIVPIGEASAQDIYVGVAGEFVESHPRWGVTLDWSNPLLNGGVYESDFIVGGNAGTLNIYSTEAAVLDGSVSSQAFGGEKQVQGDTQPTGGTFTMGATDADGTLGLSPSNTGETGLVILQNAAPQLNDLAGDPATGFSATTPLDTAALGALSSTDPNNVLATTVVPVNTLNSAGFSNVSVTEAATGGTGIVVAPGTQLVVQPGGSIKLDSPGAPVTVLGSLFAQGGTIAITAGGSVGANDLEVGSAAVISVAGQWVNNDTQAVPGSTAGDSEYINGGSVSLETETAGQIDLEAGSLINLASGGEVQSNGQLLMSNGTVAGLGGSLSLVTNAGLPTLYENAQSGSRTTATAAPPAPLIQMDGTIDSYGFAGGGTLTLQDWGFQIGGSAAAAPSWDLVLPTSFFSQQGFGKYVLNAIYDTTVAAGADVIVTQKNLIPITPALLQAATNADITAGGLTTVGTLDAWYRQPTDLVLTAGNYLVYQTQEAPSGATGSVVVGAGATIRTDAGASVGLGSPVQVTVLGSIIAPGGSITLSADSTSSTYALPGEYLESYTSSSKSVWLGADAVLDVAGVALTDPDAAPVREGIQTIVPDTGKVLSGGSITISDDSGYVIAQAGAVLDVSGAVASFDELQANGHYAAQPVWSNAGSITIGATNGLYFDATLEAQPGASQGQGGTLTLLPEQSYVQAVEVAGGGTAYSVPASVILLQQSGDLVPVGLAPGEAISSAPTGVLQFAVDRLTGSGIANLVIGGDVGSSTEPSSVPVALAGNVNVTLPGAIDITTGQLVALNATQVQSLLTTAAPAPSTGGSSVLSSLLASEPSTQVGAADPVTEVGTTATLSAPYVAIVGPYVSTSQMTPVEAAGDATLNINASFIDLVNQVQLDNFGQATFTSRGDIRLSSTNASLVGGSDALMDGELFSSGNLTFAAADLYPSTGSTFVLDAVGPSATTITFESTGTSGVPLSAGGTLLVDASTITQDGTVRAPAGSLIFGVGDATNAATLTQFNSLPLVDTQTVTFGAGSLSSVSLDGAIVPYGTTLDGVEWQFNPVPGASPAPDVTAPPQKYIGVNATSVALNSGATIDLSGGGDLQAEEWVPGTGGTRNVLSQYTVSYANTSTGTAVPTNVGATDVYAILPGAQNPVSAYDPVFAQTTQPSTSASGAASTTTVGIGVGKSALDTAVGESVYLSGVPGLPAGYYTLLPADYATLPGAFRVTVSSAAGAVVPGSSETLPDGTVVVAGYFGNALTGSRSATPTLFDVQSGAVWQQYSAYTLTSANAFFPAFAAGAGTVTPPLPQDGGQLVLAAGQTLTLGASLNMAAAAGGAPAEVDIASQDIQIVGNGGAGEAALPGYLQISADQLDALNAGSLLIGGTRTQTSSGITIDAIANSVVVSNDAADPLTGPEIILVTTSGSSTDPNAATGLRVDPGSVITAQGSYPAAKDEPITIGQNASTTTANGVTTTTPAISGDGALLEVSNGGVSVVTRLDTTGTGVLSVAAGATLNGGQTLTLDSSGSLSFDPAANLSANTIAVDGSAITFTNQTGAAAAALPGFVVGATQLAQLAAAKDLILRSAGVMTFDGTLTLSFANDVELSAGEFASTGGAVTIDAPVVAFTNDMGAPVPTGVAGTGTLTVNAGEIDLGTGNRTLSGFGSASFNATGGVVGEGSGTFDFGALPVTFNAPVYLADTGSAQTVETTGTLTLNSATGTPLALSAQGGAISFKGGTLDDNGATIEAAAGNVSLEATTGDLTIGNGSLISSAGIALPFFDITEYAPGGAISLTADAGTVNVEQGATLDFAGAADGGAAGSLSLSATSGTVTLAGTINGRAASGFLGGSFSLDTGGAVDLDSLASELAAGGVNNAITVQTGTGNLMLSAGNTLTGRSVTLTANGGAGSAADTANGNVIIDGTINANGVATAAGGEEGGTINLYGTSGVDLEGTLLAEGSDAYLSNGAVNASSTELGGTVNIGTSGTATVGSYNAQYGYENVALANSGQIKLGADAKIDVSGGGVLTLASDGLEGGVVNLRAPLLSDGATTGEYADVVIGLTGAGSGIVGARAVNLDAYAVWSTTDSTTGAQHFDGIVDPAGWYQAAGPNGTPQLVAGTFTDQSGNTITYTPGTYDAATGTWTTATLSNAPGATWAQIKADLASDLENDYFTPTSANTDHESFYGYVDGDATAGVPGTLMSFVENGEVGVAAQFANTGIAHFNVVPAIDLDNPSASINDGNISIVTNWNLGAGTSATDLAYRFDGQAPVITFRAENNVEVDASLTDGFFQIANPTGSGTSIAVPNDSTYAAQDALLTTPGTTGYNVGGYYLKYGYPSPIAAPANLTAGSAAEIGQYYGLYSAYLDYLLQPVDSVEKAIAPSNGSVVAVLDTPFSGTNLHTWTSLPTAAGQPTLTVAYPTGASADNPTAYLQYLAAYSGYLDSEINFYLSTGVKPNLVWVQPPPATLDSTVLTPGSSIVVSAPQTDNTPSPVAVAGNGLPLLSASLTGGSSSTFNLVAGANLSSANPLALQASELFSSSAQTPNAGGGSVTLDGHFAYDNANNPNSPNSLTLLAPTMIRTGTGSISIDAANDVTMLDSTAPAVIYTAGEPASGTEAGGTATILAGSAASGVPDIFVSPTVSPEAAGNISITAQNNITGIENVVDTTGAVTGVAGANDSQFWWQWMETGNVSGPVGVNGATQIVQTSINFGAFDQGVMSVGGNVSVSAGGNITDLAVSLPTTWYLTNASTSTPTVNTVGAGNLTVTAGGNILSGDYFVANGTGTITAGGLIGSDGLVYTTVSAQALSESDVNPNVPLSAPVSTLLAVQNGVLDVSARQGANIGAVVDPSYVSDSALAATYHVSPDAQGYSTSSAVNVSATTGDVDLGTLSAIALIGGGGIGDNSAVLPATVNLAALSGGIAVTSAGILSPSPTGNLSLIADQSINLSGSGAIGLSDEDPADMPSPLNPTVSSINPNVGVVDALGDTAAGAHAASALHADDTVPVRIYSLTGNIVDGALQPAGSGVDSGFYANLLDVVVDKPAFIEAGGNIINLAFEGQNLRADDVTRIVAGNDIEDTPLPYDASNVASLVLGGPGTFDIEAGHNIGPLTSQLEVYYSGIFASNTGIEAVGNFNNPNLPHQSASIDVLFGVAPGIDDASFIATYIDPASVTAQSQGTTSALIAFMEQYDAGQGVDTGLTAQTPASKPLSSAQAWTQFQALPSYVQQLFVEQVFFGILTDVGNGYNNPSSSYYHQYAAGYQAINTLFPASLSYTANSLGGGTNGASQLVDTGNLDIRSTTIQTQQGGSISILGPGGEALVGSSSAPPAIVSGGQVEAGPGTQGILTLEQGDIDIFTDQSLLLAQSRVFTEQGGNITIWSSNGNVNAGEGATSVANVPPPEYVCDPNHFCTLDAKGEVTGAGIATLQTIPSAPTGDANILAPRGTVDAGAAGIRVSGNLNVAALQVLNAANIQVQGKSTGVPIAAVVDTGALTAASAATSAVTQMAQNLVRSNANGVASQRHWSITVQVEGFGDDSGDGTDARKKKPKSDAVGYNPDSSLQVFAHGSLNDQQLARLAELTHLSDAEQQSIRQH